MILYLDDYYTFTCNTHTPSTGAAVDADSLPTYRIYEDETTTPILTGTMALLDDSNTVGFYSEQIQLTAANGFEYGKTYTVRMSATVGGVTGAKVESFSLADKITEIKTATDKMNFTGDYIDAQIKASDNIDFGTLQKTSLNNATPSVTVSDKTGFSLSSSQSFNLTGNITGNLSGSVGSVTGGVTVTTNSDKANYSLSTAGVSAVQSGLAKTADITALNNISVAEILAGETESGLTLKHAMQIITALALKATGGGTSSISFRNYGDTKNRLTMTVDENGNRTAVTISLD